MVISDAEVPLPIIRPMIYLQADEARPTVSFTTVLNVNGHEHKSKFIVKVYSGASNEDVEALIGTLNGFKGYAAAEGQWDDTVVLTVDLLYMEFPKCLSGSAQQDYVEVKNRVAPRVTQHTWVNFKNILSEFITKKVCNNPDAYESQQDYLRERQVPQHMPYNEYYKRLTLINDSSTWLLTPKAITRVY